MQDLNEIAIFARVVKEQSFTKAARALGLDCGPMSGFDNAKIDAAFFAGTKVKSNFLCNIGYGDENAVMPRNPRLSFDEACKIIAETSRGIPRTINILCDTALVYGFASGQKTISESIVREVIADKQQFSIFPVHRRLQNAK